MAFLDIFSGIILQNQAALWLLPLVWLIFLGLAWRRRFKPFAAFLLRLTMFVLLILALSEPTQLPPQRDVTVEPESERVVILVDQSASLGEVGQTRLREEATQLAAPLPDSYILHFANQAVLVDTPHNSPAPMVSNHIDGAATNLAAAIDTGAALLSNASSGRMVLLSDGLATTGDTQAASTNLTQAVDVFLPTADDLRTWRGSDNELLISRVIVPPALRAGEPFEVVVIVYARQATRTTLNLTQNGQTLAQDVVELSAGFNRFTFETLDVTIGPQTFEATIAPDAADDGWLANNQLAAITEIYPPPEILVVSEDLVHASQFTALLREAGFEADLRQPDRLPSRIPELDAYAGMILVDVSARLFSFEQMEAIKQFVGSLGRGLLVIGGRNSLSLGNYEGTSLADVLPVTMEPPPRSERPPVAMLLVIDHSGSMAERRGNMFTKLAMAKEAAIRATDILGKDDLLGIMMFDNTTQWVIPFQSVSDGAELLDIQQRIATIAPGGGTRILEALQASLPQLAQQPVPNGSRHAVLLTDGRSFDGADADRVYNDLLTDALEAGITLSTIAIGNGADQELLSYLADQGKGRYHFATMPDELPALTISESDILRSNSLQEAELQGEGSFQARVYAPHPMIRGLFVDAEGANPENTPPAILGYLALTPKPTAETALQVGPGDPLLTVWGYGSGRAAVWTSDSGQAWTTAWLAWPHASRFWGQLIGYTLPAPDLGLLQLQAEMGERGSVTLTANAVDERGQAVDLARTQAVLRFPDGEDTDLRLYQVGPGAYRQSVRLSKSGAYQLQVWQTAEIESPTGEVEFWNDEARLGFVVPYSAEYNQASIDAGAATLRDIAATTGGRVLTLGQPFESGAVAEIAPTSATAPQTAPFELWPYLLGAAIALWPIEIAARRWGRLRIQ